VPADARPDPLAAPIPTGAERRAPVVIEQPVTGRRTGWFVAVLLLLLVVLGGLLFAFAQTLGLTTKEKSVEVPDYSGKSYLTAIASLKELGLPYDVTQREVSATVAKDFVIRQDPAPGKVPEKTTVTLVLSTGPPAPATINLPDVTNRAYDDAANYLRSLGFPNVAASYDHNETIAMGNVFSMSPAGGPAANVPKDTNITLFVSTGPDPALTTTTQPEITAPPDTTPRTTAPPDTTPQTTAPQTTAPPDTTPQTTPDSTTP